MGGRNLMGFCCFFYVFVRLGSHWSFPRCGRTWFIICFGTEAFFSYTLVPAWQFWLICSCWPRSYPQIFRYRSINFIKLRPWNFLFLTFLWCLPRNLASSSKNLAASSRKSCFCGTRMCSNKASVPNSLPPGTQIECCASFFLSSMDETFPKIPFCTEILPLKATTTRLWQPEASRTPQPHKSCTHSPHLFAYWLGG